jgi:hypothetical protein
MEHTAHGEKAHRVRFLNSQTLAESLATPLAFGDYGAHDACDEVVIGVNTKPDQFTSDDCVGVGGDLIE